MKGKSYYFGNAAIVGDDNMIMYIHQFSASNGEEMQKCLDSLINGEEDNEPIQVFDPEGVVKMMNGEIKGQEFFDQYLITTLDFENCSCMWNARNDNVTEEVQEDFSNRFLD